MSVADQIEALRAEFPACRSITFTDLATGLVLCSANRERIRQERLDALASRARAVLDGPDAVSLAPSLCAESGQTIDTVVLTDPTRSLLFLRSPADPDEGLACECDPGADLSAFIDRARAELARIGETR